MKKFSFFLFLLCTLQIFAQNKKSSVFVAAGVGTPSFVSALRGLSMQCGYTRNLFDQFGITTSVAYSKFNYPSYHFYSPFSNQEIKTYDLSQEERQYILDLAVFYSLRKEQKKLDFKTGFGVSAAWIDVSLIPLLNIESKTGKILEDTRVNIKAPYLFFNTALELDYHFTPRFSIGLKGIGRTTRIKNKIPNPFNYSVQYNGQTSSGAFIDGDYSRIYSFGAMLKTSYWF